MSCRKMSIYIYIYIYNISKTRYLFLHKLYFSFFQTFEGLEETEI